MAVRKMLDERIQECSELRGQAAVAGKEGIYFMAIGLMIRQQMDQKPGGDGIPRLECRQPADARTADQNGFCDGRFGYADIVEDTSCEAAEDAPRIGEPASRTRRG